ncbi:MAG: T9SS type A sorting domain-containing protein [Bacteriovoracaceae bacterium]
MYRNKIHWVYLQKVKQFFLTFLMIGLISPSCFSQWSSDPTNVLRINTGQVIAMATNIFGETYVLWDMGIPRLQKMDSNGVQLWGTGKILTVDTARGRGYTGTVGSLLLDKVGNAFVLWQDIRRYSYPYYRIYSDAMMQGFSPDGKYLFPDSGIYLGKKELPSTAEFIGLYNDTSIYLSVAYRDTMQLQDDQYLQVTDKQGKLKFQQGGKLVVTKKYFDQRNLTNQGDVYLLDDIANLYKIDGNGNTLWIANAPFYSQSDNTVFPDGSILFCGPSFFANSSSDYDLLVKYYSKDGTSLLTDSGKVIASDVQEFADVQIIKSEDSSIIISCNTKDYLTTLYKINLKGELLWKNPIKTGVDYRSERGNTLITNGKGGAIIVTLDPVVVAGSIFTRAVNISSSGDFLWGGSGKIVSSKTDTVTSEQVTCVSDNKEGVIVAWTDRVYPAIPGTYIQRINASGNYGIMTSVTSKFSVRNHTVDFGISVSEIFPNPTNGDATISFSLTKQTEVRISMYNMLGQEIGKLLNSQVLLPNDYKIHWNFKNSVLNDVCSGVYIVKIETKDYAIPKKLLFIK